MQQHRIMPETIQVRGTYPVSVGMFIFQLVSILICASVASSIAAKYDSIFAAGVSWLLGLAFVCYMILRVLMLLPRFNGIEIAHDKMVIRRPFRNFDVLFKDVSRFVVSKEKQSKGKYTEIVGWLVENPSRVQRFSEKIGGAHMAVFWRFENAKDLVQTLEARRKASLL